MHVSFFAKKIDKRLINIEQQLLLSLQRALLGEVNYNLRSIGVDWDEKTESIFLFFYFDGELTSKNTSSANCVAGELSGDFQPTVQVIEKCIRVDAPKSLPNHKLIAYRRKEFVEPSKS